MRVTAKSKDKEFDREIMQTSFYPFRDHSKITGRGGQRMEGAGNCRGGCVNFQRPNFYIILFLYGFMNRPKL